MTDHGSSSAQALTENTQTQPDEASVNPLISRLKEESGLPQSPDKDMEEKVMPLPASPNAPAEEPDKEEASDEEVKKAA
jgi:hypothetical protein